MTKTNEKYELIASQILKKLGTDVGQWQKQWHTLGSARNLNGRHYTGINALTLSAFITDSPFFGTYNTLQARGLQVRKGEKAVKVIYWNFIEKENGDKIPFMKFYNVFSIDQCDGDKSEFEIDKHAHGDARVAELDQWINSHDVPIFHGGDRAYYNYGKHEIHLPPFENFKGATQYYCTAFHELVHSTGKALKREIENSFGTAEYALEELVAESGSAILANEKGLTPELRIDHVQYIKNWISALKDDPKEFAKAFSKASKAVEYLEKGEALEKVA